MATLKERAQHYCDILNFVICKIDADKEFLAKEATRKIKMTKQSSKEVEVNWDKSRGIFKIIEVEAKEPDEDQEFATIGNTKFY